MGSMDSRISRSIMELTERLSRREALQAYVPPALSVVALAAPNLSTSGVAHVFGGGDPGGGDPVGNAGSGGKHGGKKK